MSTLVIEKESLANEIQFNENSFTVFLSDGREMTIPLIWYPRLLQATKKERDNYILIGDGEGIHWDNLDEDISVSGLIAGRRSSENSESLKRWLKKRKEN